MIENPVKLRDIISTNDRTAPNILQDWTIYTVKYISSYDKPFIVHKKRFINKYTLPDSGISQILDSDVEITANPQTASTKGVV
jgi:hypothetical protein